MTNTSSWRLFVVTILGFASGLPLALTGTAIQTWLSMDNLDIATIGFFSLVGVPYTFKFLWAPLMDRFEPPFIGRRRGWLVLSQLSIALALFIISQISPSKETEVFALVAVLIAFLSASQDVVIDAYRTDILLSTERGLGSSLSVFGYRMAMILSGGVALIWADPVNGNGMTWPEIYRLMALLFVAIAVISFLFLPSVSKNSVAPKSQASRDLIGFAAVVIAVVIGYQVTTRLFTPWMDHLFNGAADPNQKKWADLCSLLLGIAFTLPLAWWASQKAKFETLNTSLQNYFSMKGATQFLLMIILYKLGDAFAGSLLTPFLLKGAHFAQAEIGVVNKVIGIWLTIVGALLGGAVMIRWGLYRSLLLFGILQMLSNLGFWLIAIKGQGAWGSFTLPQFDIVIITLKEATNVDILLLSAIGFENITGGMGTAAFVAFLMSLCNQKFTATQYALLSAFAAIGRVWVGPFSGVLSESIGWPSFFIFSTVMAIPGILMLMKMKSVILELEAPKEISLADD
jgi:PAT family beta-lactamase induction signal transducer AmpG